MSRVSRYLLTPHLLAKLAARTPERDPEARAAALQEALAAYQRCGSSAKGACQSVSLPGPDVHSLFRFQLLHSLQSMSSAPPLAHGSGV